MGSDARPKFIRLDYVVGTDGNQAAVTDFHLVMKLKQPLGLPAVFRAKASAAEHDDHRIGSLQLRKLAALTRLIAQLVIGKHSARYDVCTHSSLLFSAPTCLS